MAHLLSCKNKTQEHHCCSQLHQGSKQASSSMSLDTCIPGALHEKDLNLTQGILINKQKNTNVHFFSFTFTLACEDVKFDLSFSAYTVIPQIKAQLSRSHHHLHV